MHLYRMRQVPMRLEISECAAQGQLPPRFPFMEVMCGVAGAYAAEVHDPLFPQRDDGDVKEYDAQSRVEGVEAGLQAARMAESGPG